MNMTLPLYEWTLVTKLYSEALLKLTLVMVFS